MWTGRKFRSFAESERATRREQADKYGWNIPSAARDDTWDIYDTYAFENHISVLEKNALNVS